MVVREMLDNTVKNSEALQELVGAPVLATVPTDASAPKAPLITGDATRSPRAEALRQLRTNLQFVDVDRPVRVLVVTSALPGEGKSSTAVNLGVVFAEAGQRVLLIDADLRRPKLAEYLGVEGAVGLTNLLAGQAKPDDVVQPWGPNLWVLPSGFIPPNPSELLASRHMADLLRMFRERFDMVIIDSPPLLPVTDAAVLSTCADGAVMVARAAKTSSSQISGALRALQAVNARLLGCVLNMVPARLSDPYAYYYGSGSGNGYGHRPAAARGRQRVKTPEGRPASAYTGPKKSVSVTSSTNLGRAVIKSRAAARDFNRLKRGR
jgi:capsular exopolysaccharide synthesis family protein